MAQLCLSGTWANGAITWSRAGMLEGSSEQADRLLALYEEGNMKAQTGDLPKALALFQKGLSRFAAIDQPNSFDRTAEAALLWGLGTAFDRAERGDRGWRTLMEILGPGKQREQLPLGLALNWTHSAIMAAYRHDQYNQVAALLDALQRLGWSETLGDSPPAAEATRDRYRLLAPFRARSFEGLMQEKRFEEAAAVARKAMDAQTDSDPTDQPALVFWNTMLDAATRGVANFRLPAVDEDDEEEDDGQMDLPAVSVRWNGRGRLQWRLGQPPEDPNSSVLARLYQQAADLADAGNLDDALQAYDIGLAAWGGLEKPRSRDAMVRAMMVWGKATVQDRLAADDPADDRAWTTLMSLVGQGKNTALPLPLLLRWTQSAVIVGTRLGRWTDIIAFLVFLVEMATHPKLGRTIPPLADELIGRFVYLLEGVYGGIESQPVLAADWARSLQKRIEPPGMILLPVRDMLYHALTSARRDSEASSVAAEVLAWARQEGDSDTARAWEPRVR